MTEDNLKITPEGNVRMSLKSLIEILAEEARDDPQWSKDLRVVSTAIGGISYLDHMQSTISEFHNLQFKEMGKRTADDIDIILLKMERDILRLNFILKDYLRNLDRRYFVKREESE